MNHSYKSIWNEQTGTFVAVSENTKARGKRSSGSVNAGGASVVGQANHSGIGGLALKACAAILFASGLLGTMGSVQADVIIDGAVPVRADGDTITFTNTTAKIVFQNGGIITGLSDGLVGSGSSQAVTGGQLFTVREGMTANTTAITGHTNAITGINTTIGQQTTSIDTINTTLGAHDGRITKNTDDIATNKTNIGTNTSGIATNTASIAGLTSTANQGWNVQANDSAIEKVAPGETVSFADGTNTQVTRDGKQIKISVVNAPTFTSVTTNGLTVNNNATVGGTLNVTGVSTLSGGANMGGKKITNVAAGTDSNDVVTYGQLTDLKDELFVDGTGAKYFRTKSGKADSRATGDDSVAIGPEAEARQENSIAIGTLADSVGKDGVALGTEAKAGVESIAIGKQALSTGQNGVAMGSGAEAGGDDAIALGRTAKAAGAGVALGLGAQAAENALAFGPGASAAGRSVAAGLGAQANGTDSISIGRQAGEGTGPGELTTDVSNIAIGTSSGQNVVGGFNTGIGSGNIAIGEEANKDGGKVEWSVALGARTKAKGNDSIAIGTAASASSQGSIALGGSSVAKESFGVALGQNALASHGGGVALGSNSATIEMKDIDRGYLVTGLMANAPLSAVSVGSAGGANDFQRRISNVSAGSLDYDAVNVAQLKGAQTAVANMVGAGVSVNSDGSFSYKLGDSTYTTINDALLGIAGGGLTPLDPLNNPVLYENGTSNGVVNLAGGPSGTRITNLAAGIAASDAVNVGQMNAQIAESRVKFVGVNSDSAAPNANNEGAKGVDAVALGAAAAAEGAKSTALGNEAKAGLDATSVGATAVGYMARVDNAHGTALGQNSRALQEGSVAIGYNSMSNGMNGIAMGTSAKIGQGETDGEAADDGVAIGTRANVTRKKGIAIGTDSIAAAESAMAYGELSQARGGSSVAIGVKSHTSAENSVAMGTQARSSGEDGTAIGTNSKALATNSIAMGTDSTTEAASGIAMGRGAHTGKTVLIETSPGVIEPIIYGNAATAIGDDAKAIANNAIALGTGARAGNPDQPGPVIGKDAMALGSYAKAYADGSIALGSRAQADAKDSVALGTGSNTEISYGESIARYSEAKNDDAQTGVISVGNHGGAGGVNSVERRITNVAGGQYDTDAVNVKQLRAVRDTPWSFTGNTGMTNQTMQSDLAIVGGNVGATSAQNVKTVITPATQRTNANGDVVYENGKIEIQFAETPTFKGADMGGAKITNVADGTAVTDAVNLDQLNKSGWTISAAGGAKDKIVADENVDFVGLDANTSVAYNASTNKMTVGVIQAPTFTSVTTGGTVMNSSGLTITDGPSMTTTGIDAGDLKITNVAAGEISDTSTDAINGSQLHEMGTDVAGALGGDSKYDNGKLVTELNVGGNTYNNVNDAIQSVDATANLGWNVQTNGDAASQVAPGATVQFLDGENIEITRSGNDITVATADAVNFTSVTTGDTVMNTAGVQVGTDVALGSTGLVITGGPSVTLAGIDAGGLKITNVADGVISSTSLDAINGSQLNTLADNVTNVFGGNATNTGGDITFTNIGGTNEDTIHDAIQSVNTTANTGWQLSINGDSAADQTQVKPGDVVDFSNTDDNIVIDKTGNDVAFALNKDLNLGAAGSITTGDTVMNTGGIAVGMEVALGSTGLTIVDGPSVTTTGINAGGKTITGVAAGVNGTDAVNVNQLNADKIEYFSVESTVVGNKDNSGATGKNAIAIGPNAKAEGEGSIAQGTGAHATNFDSIAIGTDAKAHTEFGQQAATAVGKAAEAYGPNASAFGANARAMDGGTAIGAGSQTENGGIALGMNANAGAGVSFGPFGLNNNVAIGDDSLVKNNVDMAVALGTASVAGDADFTKAAYDPTGTGGITGTSALGEVSVGNSDSTQGPGVFQRRITNVAAGAEDTDAVNVSQLKAVDAMANKGWNVTADGAGSTVANIGPDGLVTFKGDTNLTVSQDGVDQAGVVNVALNENLDLGATGSITTGDTVMNTDGIAVGTEVALGSTGLTIVDGPSVTTTGIDAGGFKISNVAAGEISGTSMDAINGSQLFNLADNVTNVFGGNATNTGGDITFTDIGGTNENTIHDAIQSVNTAANAGWNVTADGAGSTVANIGPDGVVTFKGDTNLTVTQEGVDQDGVVSVALNRALDLDSVTTGDTVMNTDGVQVGTDVALNKDGVKITGGADGDVFLDNTGLTAGGVIISSVTGINAGGLKITNVAAGEVSDTSTDAINGSQLNTLADNVTEVFGGNATNTGGDITFTDIGGTGEDTIHDAIQSANTAATAGWNVTADGAGSTMANIGPDGLVTFQGDTNLTVTQDGVDDAGVVNVALNRALDLDSVTTGDTVMNTAGIAVGTDVALGNTGLTIADGPSVTLAGIDAGGLKITNVAAGDISAISTDAINGSQLNALADNVTNVFGGNATNAGGDITFTDIGGTNENTIHDAIQSVNTVANTGWQLSVNGDSAADQTQVKPGDVVDFSNADGNIVIDKTGHDVALALNEQLDLGASGSITTGDTVMNTDGITVGTEVALGSTGLMITGGPSVTLAGIDAGGLKITNVADGVISAASTDAINGSQLFNLADNVTNIFGGNATNTDGVIAFTNIGGTGEDTIHDAIQSANTAATAGWNVTADGAGSTSANIGPNGLVTFKGDSNITVTQDGVDQDGVVNVALNKDLDLDSVTTGDTVMSNAGITVGTDVALGNTGLVITGGPSLTLAGIDAGGLKITNVAAGDISVISTDAINGSQLYNLAGNVTNVFGGNATNTDGVIAFTNIGGTGEDTIHDAIQSANTAATAGWNVTADGVGSTSANIGPNGLVTFKGDSNIMVIQDGADQEGVVKVALNEQLDLGATGSITTGDTVMNTDGIAVGTDVALNKDGVKITGGAGGDIFLDNTGLTAGNVIISSATGINAGGFTITNVAPGVNGTDAVNVDQLTGVKGDVADLSDRAVKYDGAVGDPKNQITLEGDISTDGGKTGGTKISNVAQGDISADSTDAVNGSQIHDMGNSIADGMGGGSTFVDGKLVTELNVGGNTYNNVNDALTGVQSDIDNATDVANKGWNVQTNGDTASKVGPGDTVQFVNGENIEITRSDKDITIGMSKDIKVESVTAGKVTAKEVVIENGPTINQDGVDMNDKRITNLADGVNNGDAANMGQLNTLGGNVANHINRLDGKINRVENRANAGVAAALATAGLPQAYMPGKSMFSIGGGTWNGESGYAMGLSTISDNGKWVVKGTASGSSRGDYGGSVGVGYQW